MALAMEINISNIHTQTLDILKLFNQRNMVFCDSMVGCIQLGQVTILEF